jgi:ankyrin repeat protein
MAKKKKTDIFDIMVLTPEEASKMLLEEAKKETPDLQVIEDLLVHTLADVNIKDEWGGTALMYASTSKNIKCVELLLKHPKIDVNLQDNDGHTALWHTVEEIEGMSSIVKLLLEAGANPDIKHNDENIDNIYSTRDLILYICYRYELFSNDDYIWEYDGDGDGDEDFQEYDYDEICEIRDLIEKYSN